MKYFILSLKNTALHRLCSAFILFFKLWACRAYRIEAGSYFGKHRPYNSVCFTPCRIVLYEKTWQLLFVRLFHKLLNCCFLTAVCGYGYISVYVHACVICVQALQCFKSGSLP